MIDLKALREDPEPFRSAMRIRNDDPGLIGTLVEADAARRRLQGEVDDQRARQKEAGREIPNAEGERRDALLAEMSGLKAGLGRLEDELAETATTVDELLARIPNPVHDSVPAGETDEDNLVIEEVGAAQVPDGCRDHHDLAVSLGLVDLERGAKVSGSRFAYLTGDAVLLQFAFERLALDLLVPKGFVPVVPPVLVREEAMYGTGFFPTDRAQIYATEADDLYLVGTSEVPLASMHSDEIVSFTDLPMRYLGMSSCFRREAGTHGKDTRGIFRVHQFDKAEMFSFVDPAESWTEHEFLLRCEREIYDTIGLAYRIVNVCGGDLGASAAKKYDIEAWLPSEGRYRELTSTSNTTDYQARRLKIRVRDEDGVRPVHTLNGTAVAIGRAITFVLEQFQQPDGSVRVPEALVERGAPAVLSAS